MIRKNITVQATCSLAEGWRKKILDWQSKAIKWKLVGWQKKIPKEPSYYIRKLGVNKAGWCIRARSLRMGDGWKGCINSGFSRARTKGRDRPGAKLKAGYFLARERSNPQDQHRSPQPSLLSSSICEAPWWGVCLIPLQLAAGVTASCCPQLSQVPRWARL